MESLIHEDKTFENISYVGKSIKNREFENCTFNTCDFTKNDFSGNKFSDCKFIGCNLSMITLHGTSLKNVSFVDSKILGVIFSYCENFLFDVNFKGCILDYSSFEKKKMLKTSFINCSLKNAVFTETKLQGSKLDNCDLSGAIFERSDLRDCDFSTSFNFSIDPESNMMKNARFSSYGLAGLLEKYKIRVG